jgi:hypothetical protein
MAPVAGFGTVPQATGAGGGSSGTVGNTAFTTIDPASSGSFANILQQLMGRLPGAPPSYQDIINQGVNSPLLQSVLQPAEANLRDQFSLQNQQLEDEFRSAGALGSGAQGVGMARLAGSQGNQMGNLISQVISQMLPQFAQGLNQQYQNELAVPGLLGSILGNLRPQTVQGRLPTGSSSSSSSSGFLDRPFTDLSGTQNDFLNNPWLGGSFSGADDGSGGFDLAGLSQPAQSPAYSQLPGVTSFSPQQGMTMDQAFDPFTSTDYGEFNPGQTPVYAGEY